MLQYKHFNFIKPVHSFSVIDNKFLYSHNWIQLKNNVEGDEEK